MNGSSYSCDNMRVKRVQNEPSVSFHLDETHAPQTNTCFPNIAVDTQSKAQMIFYGSEPKPNSSWVMAQKKHRACAEQVGMCVPAQINIWLTLPSGYYRAEISEREVGGVSLVSGSPLFLPFSCRCRSAGITGCNAKPFPIAESSMCASPWFLAKVCKSIKLQIDEIINRCDIKTKTTH